MDTAILKGRLHDYIERADSELLLAIYVLLGKKVDKESKYDKATLEMLYDRVNNSNSASYSSKEAFDYIRNNKPKA